MLINSINAVIAATVCSVVYVLGYVLYQRYFHPLAAYPGPFWAALTDMWQVFQVLGLKQPYRLTELHAQYGSVVRYGPDKVSITDEEAIAAIYQAPSRMLPKTEYYDAFGGAHPNVFGTRDEAHHTIRRRHMSHAFSITSIKDMEQYLDDNIALLRTKIHQVSEHGRQFDLKQLLHNYVVDVLGELAFSKSFDLQVTSDRHRAPPVRGHTLLGSVMGSYPSMIPLLKKVLPKLPIASIQSLFSSRQHCAELAAQCVQRRLADLKDNDGLSTERKDLLTTLIKAKDPETGMKLTQIDLETEAFGFIIAGTHTTMATMTLLFWNLLHNPECLARVIAEIDANLNPLGEGQAAFPILQLEASLPYLRNCVKENFRRTPIFTMPLARRVTAPDGLTIAGHHFQQGTSVAVCNHAFHHNPAIWGSDHDRFDPSRWDRPKVAEKARLLMHFGLGGRQCIGKTMASTNIFKVVTTLLREFDFQLALVNRTSQGAEEDLTRITPPLISVGVSDLDGPLLVTAKPRITKPNR